MIQVNNRKIIRKLAHDQLKGQKTRSILLTLAIFLSAFMLTTVCSLGVTYYTSLTDFNLSINGSDYDGLISGPTPEQIEAAKSLPEVTHAGIMVGCVTITEYNEMPVSTALAWSDETNWSIQLKPAFKSLEGNYPEKRNDVLLSKVALKKMGITDPKLGMSLDLTFAAYDGIKQETFVLSGYFNDYSNKDRGFISKVFNEAYGTATDDLDRGRLYLNFTTPFISENRVREMEKQLKLGDYQRLYTDTERGGIIMQMLLALALVVLLIMLTAYLLIHNILLISISKDIRFYGLLKTIGTTTKQLKRMVYRQVFVLTVIGLSLGLFLGGLVSQRLVPSMLSALSVYDIPMTTSFHYSIYLIAALFVLLTVFSSSYQPAKLAAAISPIEAATYEGSRQRKKQKASKNGSKIWGMALNNIFRNRVQAFLVFLSLFVGVTSFMAVVTIISGNEADKILNTLDLPDMALINKTSGEDEQTHLFTDETLAEISAIKGVATIYPITAVTVPIEKQTVFTPYYEQAFDRFYQYEFEKGMEEMEAYPKNFRLTFIGIDDEHFDKLAKTQPLTIDREAFIAGDVGILHTLPLLADSLSGVLSQEISYPAFDDTQEITVGAIEERLVSAQYSEFYPELIVSNRFLKRMMENGAFEAHEKMHGKTPFIDHLDIQFKETYDRKTDQAILHLIQENKYIDHESKISRYDNMKQSETQLIFIGGSVAFILAFLGLMNYINLMATSINSRLKEFAILQSIGMTTKQLRKMLLLEGLGYSLISLLLTTTFGLGITYAIFTATNEYGVPFEIPWLFVSIIYAVALLICLSIPLLTLNYFKQSSIVDKLKKD
ncbi:ABC transporter permease [Candidatus Enterococcus clewellii]|uniref:ABC3 transporter permease C-terminal domain-containing protein n=1 Tax=Candidatus Enterococcus clewellii TaxID=1834193 RepID=A0A242KET1_9ENTE|nr:ABC transporter permease [Enterococcus sp. 9E7_DIV0242]OTP19050.1 hypothetical protein A5888_000864 [Enterococcus sp. 9E7_DIV0242]